MHAQVKAQRLSRLQGFFQGQGLRLEGSEEAGLLAAGVALKDAPVVPVALPKNQRYGFGDVVKFLKQLEVVSELL